MTKKIERWLIVFVVIVISGLCLASGLSSEPGQTSSSADNQEKSYIKDIRSEGISGEEFPWNLFLPAIIGKNRPCSYSITPSSGSFNAGGGTDTVGVTASKPECSWAASESLSWVNLSPTNVTGSGNVTITVTANTGAARSGSVIIAEKTYAISQAAASTPGDCGAYIAPGVWKEFDCYNLAAIGKTTNDDPFTPSWRLIGGYWQWGRKGPSSSQWHNTNTPNFAHGPTGPESAEANEWAISGWSQIDAPDDSWSDASKTVNDPCPEDYRVPTKTQWDGVRNNNTQRLVGTWTDSATNYSSAWFFGNDMMLPAAGYRYFGSGSLFYRCTTGYYWSSTQDSSSYAWDLYFDNSDADSGYNYRREGFSVRCAAE